MSLNEGAECDEFQLLLDYIFYSEDHLPACNSTSCEVLQPVDTEGIDIWAITCVIDFLVMYVWKQILVTRARGKCCITVTLCVMSSIINYCGWVKFEIISSNELIISRASKQKLAIIPSQSVCSTLTVSIVQCLLTRNLSFTSEWSRRRREWIMWRELHT